MTTQTNVDSNDIYPAFFRYGQSYDYTDIRYLVERSAIGRYITFGIVEEAFQNGISIMDGEGKELHSRHEEIVNDPKFDQHMQAIMKAIGVKRAYGWCVAVVHTENEYNNSDKVVRWYDQGSRSRAIIQRKGFDIDSITLYPAVEAEITGASKTIKLETEQELNTAVYMENPSVGGEVGKGEPVMVSALDDMFCYHILGQQAGLLSIRVGAGIQEFMVDESLFTDEDNDMLSKIMDMMENLSENTRMILPKIIKGTETEYKIYFGENAPDLTWINEILLERIAIATGIPMEKLKGAAEGLRAGETHKGYYFTQLEIIQQRNSSYTKRILAMLYDLDLTNFQIGFDPFSEMTEKEQMQTLTTKADIITKIAPHMQKIGLKAEDLYRLLKLDVEPDEKMIAMSEQLKEGLLNNTDNNGSDARGPDATGQAKQAEGRRESDAGKGQGEPVDKQR